MTWIQIQNVMHDEGGYEDVWMDNDNEDERN